MFGPEDLVVSLPAQELSRFEAPGSVFGIEALKGAPISEQLRCAIDLLKMATEDAGGELRFVARPEMFTQGETVAWLHGALAGAKHHVCLSDASTIRLIPGLENHVFFHDLSRRANFEALQRLVRRAPELFAGCRSQINTAIRFRFSGRTLRPPASMHIQPEGPQANPSPQFRSFYIHPHSLEDSLARIAVRPTLQAREIEEARLIFVPLCGAAIADRGFMRLVGDIVAKAYFDPTTRVVLGLPPGDDPKAKNAGALSDAVEGFRHCGMAIPRAVAPNVYFSSELLPELPALPPGATLLLHDTVGVWRYSAQYLRRFSSIKVATARRRRVEVGAAKLIGNVLGKPPERVRYAVEFEGEI